MAAISIPQERGAQGLNEVTLIAAPVCGLSEHAAVKRNVGSIAGV